MASDIVSAKSEPEEPGESRLRFRWRHTLANRLLATNLLTLGLVWLALFTLDQFRDQLLSERVGRLQAESDFAASVMADQPAAEKVRTLARIGRVTNSRIRLYDPDGKLLIDSWKSTGPTFFLRDPRSQPWTKNAARLLDRGFNALTSAGFLEPFVDPAIDRRDSWPEALGALAKGKVQSNVREAPDLTPIITAASLNPADYYAINTPPDVFATLGMSVVNLPELQSEVGEVVAGRPGGAVSLAVGMAQIFSGLPGMRSLMSYWYHFAIMFEAVFILTTIDSGTRVGRFLLQEFGGRVWKPLARTDWLPGTLGSTVIVVLCWSYFIWTGNVSSIWPLFGVANQLLAVVALAVATTIIINLGRQKYLWITFLPLCFLATTTLTAGYLSTRDIFWPMAVGPDPGVHVQGYVNSICTAVMLVCAVIILCATAYRSIGVLQGRLPRLSLSESEA